MSRYNTGSSNPFASLIVGGALLVITAMPILTYQGPSTKANNIQMGTLRDGKYKPSFEQVFGVFQEYVGALFSDGKNSEIENLTEREILALTVKNGRSHHRENPRDIEKYSKNLEIGKRMLENWDPTQPNYYPQSDEEAKAYRDLVGNSPDPFKK